MSVKPVCSHRSQGPVSVMAKRVHSEDRLPRFKSQLCSCHCVFEVHLLPLVCLCPTEEMGTTVGPMP